MSLHLYLKSFDGPLGERGKDGLWREKKGLLDDAAGCAELIARYQDGPGEPWFATERADVAGIAAKIGAAEGMEHVVVVGNGGSIRNVWALYLAFSERGFARKLHLLDGTDMSGLLGELLRGGGAFSPANTLIVPVSKSGETENVIQETALLMERGYAALAITSSGPSKLADMVAQANLDTFPHPDQVGGRFTAAQNNALLPLAMLEGNTALVSEIDLAFAAAHEKLNTSAPASENMAKRLALELWRAEQAGYTEVFMPIYAHALSGVGELIVQLVHESYCKAGRGQTILAAGAPESQHHTNQRYFGGRENVVGLSVCVGRFGADRSLPGGVSCTEFLHMEHAGVVAEAERRGTPHMALTLDSLAVPDVCGLIALWQWAAVYGGLLRGVNPFDQPAVEGSKQATTQLFENFGEETKASLARFTRDAGYRL
ncbi:MAG: hypothetical protein F4X91_01785 [Nitrospinae bacterium]|nr:hypothetical protein [Nitrospinota bacterium]